MSRKIAVLLIFLSIPLRAHASDERGWYPFLENKGWYAWEGQSSSTGETEKPLIQSMTQPAANSTQPTMNTSSQMNMSSQTGNQPAQSNWYK